MLLILQIILAVIAAARGWGFLPFLVLGVSFAVSFFSGPVLIETLGISTTIGRFFAGDIVLACMLGYWAAVPKRREEVYVPTQVSQKTVVNERIGFHDMRLTIDSEGNCYKVEASHVARIYFNGKDLGISPIKSLFGVGKLVIVARTKDDDFTFKIDLPEMIPPIGTVVFDHTSSMVNTLMDDDRSHIPYNVRSEHPLVLPKTQQGVNREEEPSKQTVTLQSESKNNLLLDLEKLTSLLEKGYLSNEEFQQAKAKILQS